MKGEIEREIETKLDVPLSLPSTAEIIPRIEEILTQEGWEIMKRRNDVKNLAYYDNPQLALYHEGSTLRKVTQFDRSKFLGKIRYDFKRGGMKDRTEVKNWSDRELTYEEIAGTFGIEEYLPFGEIAVVRINPSFLDIQRNWDEIELKIDTCSIAKKQLFRELELEFKRGSQNEVYTLSGKIARAFGLEYKTQQKYSRVVDALNLQGRGR